MTYGQRNGGNGRYGRGVGHRNRNRVISETTASIAGMRVAIVRKPIKNMYLRIKPPNADIVISAPQRMSQSAIERFVTERKPWIERAQRSMRQARDAQLNAQRAQNGNIGDTGASANPPAFVWTDEAKARAQRNIESQLPVLLAKWGPIVGRTPTHITLRLMSSRWGSCTPKTGHIRLNLQLGLMASRFLEYVLVHEDGPTCGRTATERAFKGVWAPICRNGGSCAATSTGRWCCKRPLGLLAVRRGIASRGTVLIGGVPTHFQRFDTTAVHFGDDHVITVIG